MFVLIWTLLKVMFEVIPFFLNKGQIKIFFF